MVRLHLTTGTQNLHDIEYMCACRAMLYMYVCHVCLQLCMFTCVPVNIQLCVCLCVCACICMCVLMCTFPCVCVYVCVYMCMCAPQGASFSCQGCLNQAAPPLSLFSYIQFLSTGPFNYISFKKLSPQNLRFQLPSYSLFLPNRPFSCIYLQHRKGFQFVLYPLLTTVLLKI